MLVHQRVTNTPRECTATGSGSCYGGWSLSYPKPVRNVSKFAIAYVGDAMKLPRIIPTDSDRYPSHPFMGLAELSHVVMELHI